MNSNLLKVVKLSCLLVLQGILGSDSCFSNIFDYVEERSDGNFYLCRPLRIPIESSRGTYVIGEPGTSLTDLASHLSKARAAKGLPAALPRDQQATFLQTWQTPKDIPKDINTETPLTGKLIKIRVKEGESVKAGDILCTVEAMKAVHDIRAKQAGKIKGIHRRAGDTIEAKENLVSISPFPSASGRSFSDLEWKPLALREIPDRLLSIFSWTTQGLPKASDGAEGERQEEAPAPLRGSPIKSKRQEEEVWTPAKRQKNGGLHVKEDAFSPKRAVRFEESLPKEVLVSELPTHIREVREIFPSPAKRTPSPRAFSQERISEKRGALSTYSKKICHSALAKEDDEVSAKQGIHEITISLLVVLFLVLSKLEVPLVAIRWRKATDYTLQDFAKPFKAENKNQVREDEKRRLNVLVEFRRAW